MSEYVKCPDCYATIRLNEKCYRCEANRYHSSTEHSCSQADSESASATFPQPLDYIGEF